MAKIKENDIQIFSKCVKTLSAKEKERLIWKQSGEKFRKARITLGITQVEIAAKIGCSPRTLSKFEAGGRMLWRSVIEQSYETAMKLIMVERQTVLTSSF